METSDNNKIRNILLKMRVGRQAAFFKNVEVIKDFFKRLWKCPKVKDIEESGQLNVIPDPTGVFILWPVGHMQPRMAMNVAWHKIINILKTLLFFAHQFLLVFVYLMCGPRQLFQCGPEMPNGWTPLWLNLSCRLKCYKD